MSVDCLGGKTKRASGRAEVRQCVLDGEMAGVAGLEPVTSAVTGQRSNQLSYTPARALCLRSQPPRCQPRSPSDRKRFGQQTPRRWGWGTPLKKRAAARIKSWEEDRLPALLVNSCIAFFGLIGHRHHLSDGCRSSRSDLHFNLTHHQTHRFPREVPGDTRPTPARPTRPEIRL